MSDSNIGNHPLYDNIAKYGGGAEDDLAAIPDEWSQPNAGYATTRVRQPNCDGDPEPESLSWWWWPFGSWREWALFEFFGDMFTLIVGAFVRR